MKNFVLTGLPCCGKSSLGNFLACSLNMDFVDTDTEIEKKEGNLIKNIFAENGEKYFRDAESNVVKEVSKRKGTVIAIGGGALLREENMAALKQNGILIFIDRPTENILAELSGDSRPLLSMDKNNLIKISRDRRGIYEQSADLHYVNDGAEEEARHGLLKLLAAHGFIYRLAVIGDPIAHTLSPTIHGAIFHEIETPVIYTAVKIAKEELKTFAKQAREDLEGFNVTIPHKRAVIPLLDEVDAEAALCQAVNTVKVRDGKLVGYNTDMEGLARALRMLGHEYKGRTVLIAGTGGAAWGAAFKAAKEGAVKIKIAGRREDKRQELCKALREHFAIDAEEVAFEELSEKGAADIFINATPIGMEGVGGDFPSYNFLDKLPKNAVVYDLVYKPARTRLIEEAEKRGIKAENGLSMLIHQAIRADEIFLGRDLNHGNKFSFLKTKILGNFL